MKKKRNNATFGWWLYNSLEYGIGEYMEGIEGPYYKFSEAKKDLIKAINSRIFDYKMALQDARSITKTKVFNS